jgi:hypothetical protein
MKNKKGDITDSLAFIITIFVFAIGFFTLAFVIPKITDGLKSANLDNSVEGTAAIDKLEDFGLNGIQRGFFFLFIGLCIAQLISAFYIDSHPIWLFLYVIFLGLTVIIGLYLGNAYEQMILSPSFASFNQGLITAIMQNSIKIVVGVGALSMIIIFSKFGYGGGSGGSV